MPAAAWRSRGPTKAIEQFVVDQTRTLANDPARLREMIAELTVEGGVDEELAKNSAEALPHLGIILQPVWEQLPPGEKADVVRELVEQVAYDGANGKLAITFRPRGIVALAAQERKQ